jgi:dihydroflavonol-4-reductase
MSASNWRVAVTGATGFVGSHVVAELSARGAIVTAIHRPSSDVSRLKGVRCAVAELHDRSSLAAAFRGCDVLVHTAAAVDFGDDWERFRAVNVEGTRTVFAAATAAGVRRVVHVSSIVAVGATKTPRIQDESAPWSLGRFQLPYVTTKREAEEVALASHPDVVVVNPGCVIGPGDHTGSEFGTLCKRFWKGRVPFYFPGGNNFVDVRDVATGVRLAAEAGRAGGRYLLTGTNRTLRQFFTAMSRAAGRVIPRLEVPAWLGRGVAEVGRWVGSKGKRAYLTPGQARMLGLYFFFTHDKARRELGYAPRPLADTLADAHAFWNPPRRVA